MGKTIKAMTLHTIKSKGEFQPPGTEVALDEAEFKRLFNNGAVTKYSGKKTENKGSENGKRTRELDYENLTVEQVEAELNKLTVGEIKTYLEQMEVEHQSDSTKAELIPVLAKALKGS